MSTAEQQPPEPIGTAPGPVGLASIYTIYSYDQAAAVAEAGTVELADTEIGRIIEIGDRILPEEQALANRAMWGVIRGGLDEGEVTPSQVPDFFRWLRYDKGIPVVTAAMVAGGAFAGYLLRYAEAHGYTPTPAPPPPAPAPIPDASSGKTVVHWGTLDVQGHHITAPGLTPAETEAISKAIDIVYRDANKVTAAAIDRMLPGLAPGQVPEALGDLFTAATVLEHQMARVLAELGAKAPAHVAGQVTGVQEALHGLEQAVALLHAQIDQAEPSPLHTHVQHNTTAIEHLRTNVHELSTVAVPEIAGAVGTLTGVVGGLDHLVTTDLAPTLSRVADEARASAAKLALTEDDCLAQLCDAENSVTTPIKQGGATPSLLRKLGGLLGAAYGIQWAAGLVATLLTILDARVMLHEVAADTGLVAGWAEAAAGAIAGDLDFWGRP